MTRRLHPPVLTTGAVPAPGEAGAAFPSLAAPANSHLTIEPWEVEKGDVLLGLRTPIATILQTDRGVWIYADRHGRIIARRPHWSKVQVVRNSPAGHLIVTPADDSGEVEAREAVSLPANSHDDCPPHGIRRPRNGLMVVPS